MEPEQILNSLRRAIKRRVESLAISVTSGGVDSMETYKYIIGQINALESVQQEISNLLNDKEQNEDRGTVINIGDKKNNNPK
jgi:asparagine synthetase B (glutamine-hydrolysing)